MKARYYDTLRANALDRLISQAYLKLLEEKKWQPANQAELISIDDGDLIKFRLRFEIMPEFKPENYLGLELLKEEPLPIEYLFEHTLNQIRERYATLKETNNPAVVDDFLTVDLEIIEDNKIKNKHNDIILRIGDRSLPDELNRALVGVKKGEGKEINIENSIYRIVVKKIEEKILPQINDDFAHLLNYENLEELKNGIEEIARKNEEARLEEEMRESLAKVLLERNKFKIPRSLISEEYQKILKEYALSDSESNKERFWMLAENRVRFNLILDRIAHIENITTDDTEINELINKELFRINKKNRDDIFDYLRRFINRKKTIDFLIKNARISERGRIILPEEVKNVNRSIRH